MSLLSGDTKSRINLKPSKEWNNWINNAFKEGRCECIRCIGSDYIQDNFDQPHTFNLDGKILSRRFAITTREDALTFLKGSWVSFYNLIEDELEDFKRDIEKFDLSLSMILAFTEEDLHKRLMLILRNIKGIHVNENSINFGSY
mgnify:CR=1 FL=1